MLPSHHVSTGLPLYVCARKSVASVGFTSCLNHRIRPWLSAITGPPFVPDLPPFCATKTYPGATPEASWVTWSLGGLAPAIVCNSPGATFAELAARVVADCFASPLPQPATVTANASVSVSVRGSVRGSGRTGRDVTRTTVRSPSQPAAVRQP